MDRIPPHADEAQIDVAEGSSAPLERGAVGPRGHGGDYKGLFVGKRHRRSEMPRRPRRTPPPRPARGDGRPSPIRRWYTLRGSPPRSPRLLPPGRNPTTPPLLRPPPGCVRCRSRTPPPPPPPPPPLPTTHSPLLPPPSAPPARPRPLSTEAHSARAEALAIDTG